MKKTRRILAVIGIVLLVAMYVSTLVFAIIGSEDSMRFFKASVYMTIVVPVLIWAYTFMAKLLRGNDENEIEEPTVNETSEKTENKKKD